MTAPAVTTRVEPVGIKLEDGFSTKIALSQDPDISFWEVSITPPGVDGGDPVQTSTMYNTTYRTMAPRALKTLTPLTVTAAYDPAIYDQIVAIINVNGAITLIFPDGSTVSFYGFVQNFQPQEVAEGTQPRAQITITPTNTDPTDGSEEGPVVDSVAGT